MESTTTISPSIIQQWVINNFDVEKVRTELSALGLESDAIELHLGEFKKLVHARRLNTGFMLAGLGAFVGFISCVLAITNPAPELYYWILYGLTSIAVCIICWGLYYILE
ncbi:MAG: hypothetical protein RLZZ543_1829 [Bacteroidota bacterium]|jgi:hypothetical protein